MSSTTFQGTALCKVPSFFNLDKFIERLVRKCILEDNFIATNYGIIEINEIDYTDEDNVPIPYFNGHTVDVDFNSYITQIENKIQIFVDSEDGDTEVWDWLVTQFIPEMTSDVMVVKSATVDSRSGVDFTVNLYTKEKNIITLTDLIENYPGINKNSYELY